MPEQPPPDRHRCARARCRPRVHSIECLWIGDPDRGNGIQQPGGWIYNSLSYLELETLRKLGRGASAAEKREALTELSRTPIPVFVCPTRGAAVEPLPATQVVVPRNADWQSTVAKTDYAINEGDLITNTLGGPMDLPEGDRGAYAWRETKKASGISFLRSQVRPAQVIDGLSSTYLAGEKYVARQHYYTSGDLGYDQSLYSGVDLDLNRWVLFPPRQDGSRDYVREFGSAHPQTCRMLFCDGSVRAISYTIDWETHRRLGNRFDKLPIDQSLIGPP